MTKEERERFKREEAKAGAKAHAERLRHGGLLHVDDDTDTLLDKPSSTPLMTGGKAGLLRVSALFVVAAMLMIKRSFAPSGDPNHGGLDFPAEVKAHGQFQTLLGGGRTAAGAIGVYLQHAPADGDWGVLTRFVGVPTAELLAPLPSGHLDVFGELGHANTLMRSLLFMFDGEASVNDLHEEIKRSIGWPAKRDDSTGSEADSAARAGEVLLAVVDATTPPPDVVPGRGARVYVTCHGEEAVVTYATAHAIKVMRKSSHVPSGGVPVPPTASYGPGVCPLLFDAYLGVVADSSPHERIVPSEGLRREVADGFRAHTQVGKDEM